MWGLFKNSYAPSSEILIYLVLSGTQASAFKKFFSGNLNVWTKGKSRMYLFPMNSDLGSGRGQRRKAKESHKRYTAVFLGGRGGVGEAWPSFPWSWGCRKRNSAEACLHTSASPLSGCVPASLQVPCPPTARSPQNLAKQRRGLAINSTSFFGEDDPEGGCFHEAAMSPFLLTETRAHVGSGCATTQPFQQKTVGFRKRNSKQYLQKKS